MRFQPTRNAVSVRINASEEGTLKRGVAYQLADTVTAAATYDDMQQQQGAAAGDTAGGRTELSVDWRFHRNWSVRARVGNESTGQKNDSSSITSGVDLLWQYRY